MVAEIDQAHKDGDTLGGVRRGARVRPSPWMGSHVHWDRRLDSRLAGALMGIQAIKGVEVGDGFDVARGRVGCHDEIETGPDGIVVRRVALVGPRAACRPVNCCGSGPR
jgi:chorismate synthase